MFSQASPSVYRSSKCFITYGSMGHVDTKQIPRRGKPWSSIMALDYVHKMDLVIPQESYQAVRDKIVTHAAHPRYYRVNMSLENILQGDFFSEYIKKGDVLMVSEGQMTINNMFTLKEGTLTLYLDKEAYERAGLVGKPYGAKGNRGSKPRWIVTYDLQSPSMVHGKKGFERLVHASKKVLNQQLTWLFCNLGPSSPNPNPLEKFFPTGFTSVPTESDVQVQSLLPRILPEVLADGDRQELEYQATEWYEWLSLVRLQSPRVDASDNIDPYLCRYQAPEGSTGTAAPAKLCKVSWQGFMSPQRARQLLVDIISACPPKAWFSFSATEFSRSMASSNDEVTVLRPADAATGEYLMWEIRSKGD